MRKSHAWTGSLALVASNPSTHKSAEQFGNCFSHLSVRWGVDDVIHRGWRGENGHISGFEMLDPVAELRPIQTRHHDGVDQLPWEERRTKRVIRPIRSLECATVRLSFWG